MAVNNPDPDATEPKTLTMPYGGQVPKMVNVNPDKPKDS